ncbi:MAG: hypothetical protein KKE20_00090, partial [Nanoarchaeota archaeon]|nr:hypothetical protein [Nanoarchaeota archaeon]
LHCHPASCGVVLCRSYPAPGRPVPSCGSRSGSKRNAPRWNHRAALPKGVFDRKTRFLKPMLNSKIKQTLIDSYNMAVAMDPALVTFLQASPFVDGRFLAKDSRVLLYRGGRDLGYTDGLYTGYTQYGGLPPYKQTLTDLMYTLKSRHARMKRLLEKQNIPSSDISKYGKILDFCWNPVRINKIGTIEQRSADMNFIEIVIAASVLIKYVQRMIHQDFMKVIPSEIGIEEPFKVEGNTVYIPPHTHVRKHLQYLSAHKGLEDKDVYNYCTRFFKFARACSHERYAEVIAPLNNMLEEKKTVSDMLISYVKKKGYSLEEKVPDEVLAEMCLDMAKENIKKLDTTEELVKNLD